MTDFILVKIFVITFLVWWAMPVRGVSILIDISTSEMYENIQLQFTLISTKVDPPIDCTRSQSYRCIPILEQISRRDHCAVLDQLV